MRSALLIFGLLLSGCTVSFSDDPFEGPDIFPLDPDRVLHRDDMARPYHAAPVTSGVNNPRSTKFGKRVEMPVDPATDRVDPGAIVTGASGDIGEVDPKLAFYPGSWVVTLELDGFNFTGVDTRILPLKARIEFGSGGISQNLEVDVAPGTIIEVPAQYVRVNFFWSPEVPLTSGTPGPDSELPATASATVSIVRSFTDSIARHTQYLQSAAAGGATWLGTVPKFSRSWMVYDRDSANPVYAATTLYFFFTDAGDLIATWNGAEVGAVFAAGNYIKLPGNVSSWRMFTLGPAIALFPRMVFETLF